MADLRHPDACRSMNSRAAEKAWRLGWCVTLTIPACGFRPDRQPLPQQERLLPAYINNCRRRTASSTGTCYAPLSCAEIEGGSKTGAHQENAQRRADDA